MICPGCSASATAAGHSDWGYAGPDNAGTYDSTPSETGFFSDNSRRAHPFLVMLFVTLGLWSAVSRASSITITLPMSPYFLPLFRVRR